MKCYMCAVAMALTACATQKASEQPTFERIQLAARSNGVSESVEERAQCVGFYRAHANLAPNDNNKAAFYANAATNAEIAAKELAASQVPIDFAFETVNRLAQTSTAEWSILIKLGPNNESVLFQAEKCQAFAQQQ